ncbi:DUF1801 domain-containing protein [Paenibacillus antri]|uniref:DUF1801 domain-containing protein n=1 Tax=Paenibacillus antri TaxID=2582848 RepID=A0A5R9G666_9BACL|nr:DUF1801 domain-containing protein [Paenibacillus antri]TLS48454.1 DUF1801 domain-containing protein [Paenibacillus antri]
MGAREKRSGEEQVAEFLSKLEHPLKREIEEVRKLVLGTGLGFAERIKWNAPSFAIDGEDRITFQLRGEGLFRLIFHCGAKSKSREGSGRLIDDGGWLEWASDDRAIAVFTDMDDVRAKEDRLRSVVAKWVAASRG